MFFKAKPNPIALFRLDNAQEVVDISYMKHHPGNAFNVTLSGGLSRYFNSSLSFTGASSSFVSIPHTESLDFRQSFTVLLWVLPKKEFGPLFYYGTSSSGFELRVSNSTLLVILISDGRSQIEFRGPKLNLHNWNLVGTSYDYYKGAFVLYCHNVSSNTTSRTERIIGTMKLKLSQQLTLAATLKKDDYFEGSLACLQIYETKLTDDEMVLFYKSCWSEQGK